VRLVRRARLAVRIYLYTLFCVVLAVALFVLIAVALRPDPPHERFAEPRPPMFGAPGALAPRGPPPDGRPGPRPGEIPSRLFILTGIALLGVVLITSIAFARSLARPLQRLEEVAAAFGRGEHEARTGLVRSDEIGAVALAFDDMADQTTQLMQSQRELMGNVSHELRTPLARMRVAPTSPPRATPTWRAR
jgi:signal transduction histidine kinase